MSKFILMDYIEQAMRNVSSQMRHFHQEFSVETPRFLRAVC